MLKKSLFGVMQTLLLISMLTFAKVQSIIIGGTVYIRADGSVDPSTAPIQRSGDNYTLTGNIASDADGIVIERDNMTLDGAGYKIWGNGVGAGICLIGRSNVTIKNTEIETFNYGVELRSSSNNSVVGNNVRQTFVGKANILLYESNHNNIVGNNVTDCWSGFLLYYSHNNSIVGNNITEQSTGICIMYSSNNSIYHNRVIRNEMQAYTYDSANAWDNGYPSGGNCWSDYWGVDSYSGPSQNETGSDNIGDTPYVIDENNVDHYPLLYPRSLAERHVISHINGSRAYDYDLEMENIAFKHYAFRSGGSAGANETANWIKGQFESFGLEAWLEPFEFTTWDLLSKPSLFIDDDGNRSTTLDQVTLSSFQSEHYSWPTSENGSFADLVVLPLPEATDYFELGKNPINTTAWNAINTTGKIVLIGLEVRWVSSWHRTYVTKLRNQHPAAVVYTWWYDWMSFTPPLCYSTSGRPLSSLGSYYWDLEIPVGSVNYEDGLWIRNREDSMNVSAQISIRSVISTGTHYNVVGKIRGYKNPEKMIIISSHYDTVMCSGFCDNGAGTAGVVEMAKVFADVHGKGVYKPSYTLLFVAFASEELYLVGSINYVKQHKDQMANIIAVVNLDCIGSDELYVTQTNSVNGFDLDETIIDAAKDLRVSVQSWFPMGSDHATFLDPWMANLYYYQYWGLQAGISDATPVASSSMLISYPLLYDDYWWMGMPGWIHTEYDNSTSTGALDWVEAGDLEKHIKVAALATVRISPDASYLAHNIAAVGVKPDRTIVSQTQSVSINLTVENRGWHAETFNVTLYANTTIIATFENITLESANSTTITFTWNTTGFARGNYTISAIVWPVPGEVVTSDNTCEDGIITVVMLGDVNADGKINILDLVMAAGAFGATPGSWAWNPQADIWPDGVVNIFDLVMIARRFGQQG